MTCETLSTSILGKQYTAVVTWVQIVGMGGISPFLLLISLPVVIQFLSLVDIHLVPTSDQTTLNTLIFPPVDDAS